MDLRSLQKPLKEQYRSDPNASRITLRAKGGQTDVPVACSVDIGRAIYQTRPYPPKYQGVQRLLRQDASPLARECQLRTDTVGATARIYRNSSQAVDAH